MYVHSVNFGIAFKDNTYSVMLYLNLKLVFEFATLTFTKFVALYTFGLSLYSTSTTTSLLIVMSFVSDTPLPMREAVSVLLF